jgi:hypothetical protein
VYSEVGEADKIPYFEKTALDSEDDYARIYAVYYYSILLGRMDPSLALDGISFIEKWGNTDPGPYTKNVAKSALKRIKMAFEGQAIAKKIESEEAGLSKSQKLALESEMLNHMHVIERAEQAMGAIK